MQAFIACMHHVGRRDEPPPMVGKLQRLAEATQRVFYDAYEVERFRAGHHPPRGSDGLLLTLLDEVTP